MISSLVFVLRPEWKAMVLPPTATAELNLTIQSNCFYISVQPAQIDEPSAFHRFATYASAAVLQPPGRDGERS